MATWRVSSSTVSVFCVTDEFFRIKNFHRLLGLNLVDDVVHRSYASNIVYGQRSFEDLHIEHLHCGEFCYVQGVNLNSWMLQSVYLEGNHSVQGITVLESPEVLGNIR